MRVAVIRGDLPGPLVLADLEPVSQHNPPTEPRGQERYLSRPTIASVEAVLRDAKNGVGATIEGADVAASFPLTIGPSNDVLRVRLLPTGAFSVVRVARATYATIATLLAALQVALGGSGITARQGTGSGSRVALESNSFGVNSYLELDANANGSTANAALGFVAGGAIRTMPSAAELITALLPVGGPVNVSAAAMASVGTGPSVGALGLVPSSRGIQAELANAIAPQFVETPVAVESFQVGMLFGYRSAGFNPDRRLGLANGPAVAVVADDGVTPFRAPLPTIVSAVLGAGVIVVAGEGFGHVERAEETIVRLTGNIKRSFDPHLLEKVGGEFSPNRITIPVSLALGAAAARTKIQVKVRSRASNVATVST